MERLGTASATDRGSRSKRTVVIAGRLLVVLILAFAASAPALGADPSAQSTVTEYADRVVFVDPAPQAECDELRRRGKAKSGPCVITTTFKKLHFTDAKDSALIGRTAGLTAACAWGTACAPYRYAKSYFWTTGPWGWYTFATYFEVKLNGYYIHCTWTDHGFSTFQYSIDETWTGCWNQGGRTDPPHVAPYVSIGSNWIESLLGSARTRGHRMNIKPNGDTHGYERW